MFQEIAIFGSTVILKNKLVMCTDALCSIQTQQLDTSSSHQVFCG